MAGHAEPISVRTTRLNKIISGRKAAPSRTTKLVADALSREGLVDALCLLYNECNKEQLKKRDKQIYEFVSKYRPVIQETEKLRVSARDFDVKTIIGKGYFGDVFLVSEKATGDMYALKKIKKELVTSAQVKEERDIMANRSTEWITHLQYAFQDADHLCLVMEYLPGGDLLSLMMRNGPFDEDLAKFYLAELALAINALHTMGYVHRDIKPENILIDRFGHVKLADFGNAAALDKDGQVMSLSPVGTPDYIAPELLQTISTHKASKSVHDVKCDFWSMGIIGYELVCETTPFHDENVHETYSKILSFCDGKEPEKLSYPPDLILSRAFRRLLEGLVTKARYRLSFANIQKNEFFEGINWSDIRQAVPPIIPTVNSDDDVSNFEDIERIKNRRSTFVKTPRKFGNLNEFSGQDLPFLGYGYVHEESIAEAAEEESILAPQVNKLNAKIRELQRTNKGQTDEMKTLQEKLLKADSKANQTDSVNKILRDTKEELSHMKDRLKEKTADLAASRTEIKTLKSSLKIEEEMRLKSDASISKLLASTYQKWEKAKQMSDQNYEKLISEKKTEIANILQRLEACENELNTKSDQCSHLQEKIDNYKEMLKTNKDQSVVDRQELEKSKSHIAEAYEAKISELQEKLRREQTTKTQMSDELRDVRSELDESICSTNSNRQAKLAIAKNVEDLKRRLNKEVEENNELRSETLRWKKQSEELEKTCDNLRAEIEKLKQEQESLEEHHRRSYELESGLSSPYRTAHGSLTDLQAVEEQLRNDLMTAKENEDLQRKRADQLENAVAKLEEMIDKLSEQPKSVGDMLEKQNEKLEDELTTAREQMIVERQAARTASLSLWKVEKQLDDVKLDKKRVERRMELTEDRIKKVQVERDEIQQKLKLAEGLLGQRESRIEELRQEITDHKTEIQKEHKLWEKAEQERMKEKSEVIEQISAVHKLEEKTEECRVKMLQALQKNDSVSLENKRLLRELTEERERHSCMTENHQQLQMKLKQTEDNYEMLKVACGITDTQLSEIEIMLDAEMKRNQGNAEKIDNLWKDLRRKDEEIGKLKQSINGESAAKIAAETKLKNLRQDIEELKANLESCHQKIIDQQKELVEKTTALFEAQERGEVLTSDTANLQTVNSNYGKEIQVLKEENTRILTDLFMAREEASKLTRECREAQETIDELQQEIEQLNGELEERRNYNIQRDIKSEATLAQHKKLIDYLQLKVEDLSQKKKKTLADMIFGSGTANSKKENLSPNVIESSITYRTLYEELKRERANNKTLKEQLDKAKSQHMNNQRATEERSPRKEPELKPEQTFVPDNIVHTSFEASVKRTDTTASAKRRTHQSHRFELTLENVDNMTCEVCVQTIMAGSPHWRCKECKSSVHRKCRSGVQTGCDGVVGTSANAIKPFDSAMTNIGESVSSLCQSVGAETNVSADSNATYHGELIFQAKSFNPNLKVNCAYEINDEVLILGCNTGLYSYHFETAELVHITGIESVHYIAISKKILKAILIGSQGEYLYQCDLRHLQARCQTIACMKPKLEATVLDLPFANRAHNERWHLVRISNDVDGLNDAVAIAATSTRIVILKYDLQLCRFKPVRALDAPTAVSSILFTKHSAIVSSDKFFEIDLNSYVAEEFVDIADPGMVHTRAHKPMAAFRISVQEFLLCFEKCGIFVDEYGCRSRPYDLNWNYTPTGFLFREPLLFISHFQLLQVIRIHRSYSNEAASSSEEEEPNTLRTLINFDMPTLLGEHGKLSVYIAATERETSQQEIYLIDGAQAVKSNTNVSLETLSSQATCITADSASLLSSDMRSIADGMSSET